MTRFLVRVLATASLLFISSLTSAQFDGNALCSDKDGIIFFGNGVDTEFTGATDNLLATSYELQRVMSDDEYDATDFQLAFNASNGLVLDLVESAAQDASTDFGTFFMSIFGLNDAPEGLQEEILTTVGRISNIPSLILTDSLANHVQIYKANILEGKKILLIAHSQGTFYANQAYSQLTSTEQESFGILPVALMDDYVAGDYPDVYVTLSDDLVVLLVGVIKSGVNTVVNALIDKIVPWGYAINPELRGPKDWNTENTLSCDEDFLGHSYTDCYLARNSDSLVKIDSFALYVYRRLAQPASSGNDGIITVTLTWGSNPDVDLHVIEPNGTQVFYDNKFGPSGHLDRDVTDGMGPEHYFASCENLEAGTYQVGVNYYSGYTPETASVVIQSGFETRSMTKFLGAVEGSAGNLSPDPVANIIVTGDSSSGYEFNIVPYQPSSW